MSTSARINALVDAVIEGNLTELMYTVTPRNVNCVDQRYGLSLLFWAVSLGRLPTVEFLLGNGASICRRDAFGFSVLHRAVWCGDVEVVRAVLFLSPSSRVWPQGGGHHADQGPSASDKAPLATSSSVSPAPLQWRPGAQRLVDLHHDGTGRTALMLAAVRGHCELVAFLVNVCGASLFDVDGSGLTVFDLAALCGQDAVLKLLLAAAPGDGTGGAYPVLQQRMEEYCEAAKTIPQRDRMNDINRFLGEHLAAQSMIKIR